MTEDDLFNNITLRGRGATEDSLIEMRSHRPNSSTQFVRKVMKVPRRPISGDAPRRALSGFMFFSQMETDNLKKLYPGISFTDVSKVLGKKWQKMSAEEKEPYEAKAGANKKRYINEISACKNRQQVNVCSGIKSVASMNDHFQKSDKKESEKELSSQWKSEDSKKKRKKKRDPTAPKRAMSGFMFFSQLERENIKESNTGMSFTDVARAIGHQWKMMSPEEKKPYEEKALADKKRYKDEISGYKNTQAMNSDSLIDSDSD